jgi:hypothetical protein
MEADIPVGGTVKSRLIASLALGAAIALGTTGCAFITPVSTSVPYSPSDGMNVPVTSGPLQVRNALVVANEDGTKGNLVAAIINDTDTAETLNLDFDSSGSKRIRVPAHSTVSLGAQGTDPLPIANLGTKPGQTVPITFQSGDATGVTVMIPVLSAVGDYKLLAP